MGFTDQMVAPKSVRHLPKHLQPSTVTLASDNKPVAAAFPTSPLGVWYLEGCGDFLQTVEATLAYHNSGSNEKTKDLYNRIARMVRQGTIPGNVTLARGRRNLNLKAVPPQDNEVMPPQDRDARLAVTRLQKQAAAVANQVSRRMEIWLDLPKGSMQHAHAQGNSSSLRLLDYPMGVAVPPHTDGSAYTLVYSPDNRTSMMIQDPQHDDIWYPLPPGKLLLMLGSHLDQAIPSRLEQVSHSAGASVANTVLRAPVHRLGACDTPRRALTLHIKADKVWPAILEELNKSNDKVDSTILTAADYHARDIAWDAELFSQYLLAKYIPPVESVQDHWKSLAAIVEGYHNSDDLCGYRDDDTTTTYSSCSSSKAENADNKPFRLPTVHCTGYWQLQTSRYLKFLLIHRQYPDEARGMLPPRPIHHVWLCHQLHPTSYQSDCENFLGRLLDHENGKFCLEGCPKFHRLWKRVSSMPWPSHAELYKEVQDAEGLPEVSSTCGNVITANLWHNYDGLARLFDEVQQEAPNLMKTLAASSKEPPSCSAKLLCDARLEYARFLVAASYAATANMTVTPSGPVDLVWHTHQTNPKAYQETMKREFPTSPIDHVPCGELNPPPNDGKEWLRMTNEIWTKLYGHSVNVQGHAIHCCTPMSPRPEGLEQSGEGLAWWFPRSPTLNGIEDFPATGLAARQIADLSDLAASIRFEEVQQEILQPLKVLIMETVSIYKEEKEKTDFTFCAGMVFFWVCMIGSFLLLLVLWGPQTDAEGERTTKHSQEHVWFKLFVSVSLAGLLVGCWLCRRHSTVVVPRQNELITRRNEFWREVQRRVDSFDQKCQPLGFSVSFSRNEKLSTGPNPGYRCYEGPALVFHRYRLYRGQDV